MDNTEDSYFNLTQYKRVLKYATTPTMEEFKRVSLIAGAGIFLIGVLGFAIFLLMSFLPG